MSLLSKKRIVYILSLIVVFTIALSLATSASAAPGGPNNSSPRNEDKFRWATLDETNFYLGLYYGCLRAGKPVKFCAALRATAEAEDLYQSVGIQEVK